MKKGILLLITGAGLFASSCYYDNKEDLYQFVGSGCDTTGVTFAADVLPVFQQNCAIAGCHSSASMQSNLDLGTYEDINTIALDGRLMTRITKPEGDPLMMPPGAKLPDCTIDKIQAWINNGALNN